MERIPKRNDFGGKRMTIFKRPRLIDRENDKWEFYCPNCKKWQISLEHGYSSEFSNGIYLECPVCGYKRSVPQPVSGTIKDFYFLMRDIYYIRKEESKSEKMNKKVIQR
jgi:transcription elongation factor Elf1